MGPKTVELLQLLQDTIELLQGYGERWADWMYKSRRRIKAGDLSGVTLLLKAYGGMASFSDLVIHPLNGHDVKADEVEQVNERLQHLRHRMYELAIQIKREAVIDE